MKDAHLLLLPGLLNDARLWQWQVSALSEIAHVSVADLTQADSIASMAAYALAQLPAEKFALAGLSMGGYVALEIMRQAPERVVALALLDTSARPDASEATETRRRLMKLAETNFPAVLDLRLSKLIHAAHRADHAIVEVITAMSNTVGKKVFARQQEAIIGRIDSRPFLSQIKCPTLVLCGREDETTPVALHEEMAAAIPHARLVIVEECGHLSTLDQPRQVTEALRQWLQDVPW